MRNESTIFFIIREIKPYFRFIALKKNILFVINPISGGKEKSGFPEMVNQYLDLQKFSPSFAFTRSRNHAFQLASAAAAQNTDVVVAVGGDGTINEVASALEGTPCAMGIVPCGSGNGLARTLQIPLNHRKAISAINALNVIRIDTGVVNDRKFFNMAGIGFDAQISFRFANLRSRGFSGYLATAFREIVNYKCKVYKIEVDGVQLEREAFMVSVANSSQYGNNAHISPTASLTDGLLDVCIVKPFPLYLFPAMGYRMFSNTSDKSRYVEIIKGQKIRIESCESRLIHLDGEPETMDDDICISVNPLSLSVLK